MPGRRRLVFAGIVSMALAAASIVSVQAGSATTPRSIANLTGGRVGPGRLVNVRHLPAAPAVGVARDLSFLTRNPRTLAAMKASSPKATTVERQRLSAHPLTNSPGTVTEEELTVFEGMNLKQQIDAIDQSEGRQPPDTQVAAGPSLVMEMDNRTGSFWTKGGTLMSMPGNPFDLQPFFVPSPGPASCPSSSCLISGPRLLYDAPSGRWLASANRLTPQLVGTVFFAISTTSDATARWSTYSFGLHAPGGHWGIIPDSPNL